MTCVPSAQRTPAWQVQTKVNAGLLVGIITHPDDISDDTKRGCTATKTAFLTYFAVSKRWSNGNAYDHEIKEFGKVPELRRFTVFSSSWFDSHPLPPEILWG